MKLALSRTLQNENSNIRCFDPKVLDKELDLPSKIRTRMIPLVVIAVIIGALICYFVLDGVLNAKARDLATIEQTLLQKTEINIPKLVSFVGQSDAEILSTLQSSGNNVYELGSIKNGDSLDIIKLPPDLTKEKVAAYYVKGIKNLTSPEIVKLLYGSWNMETSAEDAINISLHYVDFGSFDENTAVQVAMDAQGFTTEMSRASGKDESGNTYVTGDIQIGEVLYSWRVACVPASSVYSQENLPHSYYVGIRIFA